MGSFVVKMVLSMPLHGEKRKATKNPQLSSALMSPMCDTGTRVADYGKQAGLLQLGNLECTALFSFWSATC